MHGHRLQSAWPIVVKGWIMVVIYTSYNKCMHAERGSYNNVSTGTAREVEGLGWCDMVCLQSAVLHYKYTCVLVHVHVSAYRLATVSATCIIRNNRPKNSVVAVNKTDYRVEKWYLSTIIFVLACRFLVQIECEEGYSKEVHQDSRSCNHQSTPPDIHGNDY